MDKNSEAISEKNLSALSSMFESLPPEKTAAYYQYLVDSDALLKETIIYFQTQVRPTLTSGGGVEFGILPYWIAHPEKIPDYDKIPDEVLTILKNLVKWNLIPPPTIKHPEYEALLAAISAGTAFAYDGTMFGEGPYEQLNSNWLQAVVNDWLTDLLYGKAGFGGAEPTPLNLPSASGGSIKIAIIGDWGTGKTDALDVINAAMAQKPDYLIHLGDVYYTGTPDKFKEGIYWAMNNEKKNLIDVWPPKQATGTSFTLNSNHEMYCGARGYFDDALGSSIFSSQHGKSYFLLQNSDWQIFGLDSAYNSPAVLYMKGALNSEQIKYIQKYYDPGKKTIVMCHHNAYDVTGETIVMHDTQSLWGDVLNALGGNAPDYWYWGHIHDGVIYKPLKVNGKSCYTRCVGHSAMPYGAPWGLTKPGSTPPFGPSDNISTVEFFADTLISPDVSIGQVKNGFMLIALDRKTIKEEMYDSDGTCTWSS